MQFPMNSLKHQPLSRTQSMVPRLRMTDSPQQQPTQQQFWPQHNLVQSSVSLGPAHPLTSVSQASKSRSFENIRPPLSTVDISVDSEWTTDTTLPPPPPRTPWSQPTKDDPPPNAHRPLARQLTLNPNYDPRIHRGHTPIPFPPPNTSVPPPAFHQNVTRNASAPETPPRSGGPAPYPLTAVVSGPPGPPSVTPPRLNSTTSDSQLNKSEGAWSNTAVSPFISGSGGVWSESGEAKDRSKLYYHLANLFEEEKVRYAMKMMPEETNADKLCQYIIFLKANQQQQP